MRIGLKIGTAETSLIEPAIKLFHNRLFHYIELYIVPGSYERTVESWRNMPFQFVLHAPHSYSGFNFSRPENESTNFDMLREVELFRKAIAPTYIIFHPGIEGTENETIRQIQVFQGKFPEIFSMALVENKPQIGIGNEKCIGYSVSQIKTILKKTGLGFCFDFGHAICSSVSARLDWRNVIQNFIKLEPSLYHLSDGLLDEEKDRHLHYGFGNYDLIWMLSLLDDSAMLSIEAKNDSQRHLNDFEKDVEFLNKYRPQGILNG